MPEPAEIMGIVRGRTIELAEQLDAPDGAEVRLVIQVLEQKSPVLMEKLPGFGALADLSDELAEFDEWYRAERRRGFSDAEQSSE